MTTESVTINTYNEANQPTLEEQAKAAGIDTNNLDPTALSQGVPDERPSWLPAKFKTVEDFAKSYNELEKKLGSKSTDGKTEDVDVPSLEEVGQEKQAKNPEPKPTSEVPKSAEEAVEKAGLNFQSLQAHYDEHGSLADSSYEALEKAGIPRSYVDQFIEGQEAVREVHRQAVFQIGGGETQFRSMMAWGADNLGEAEIDVFNKDINSSDKNRREAAARNLVARYEAANGAEPVSPFKGGGRSTAPGDRFESMHELTAAMSDPRYGKDPAYTKRVEEKVYRSDIW